MERTIKNSIIVEDKFKRDVYWDKLGGKWVAEVPEMRICMAAGDTPVEAVKKVGEMLQKWLLAKEKMENEENGGRKFSDAEVFLTEEEIEKNPIVKEERLFFNSIAAVR